MINMTNSTPLQTLDSDPKQTTQHREKSRLARTGPGTGNPYETNESPRTPEETTPLFVGERIGSSPHAGAGKVPASRSRSTRSPITAAVRLRTRRQRCPDLGSLFFSPDVSLVQWRGWRGGSNEPTTNDEERDRKSEEMHERPCVDS